MPTYSIPDQAVIEVQVLGRLHEQRTRTTFHYLLDAAASLPDGAAELEYFIEQFHDLVWDDIHALLSNEYDHEFTTAQLITPTRYRAVVDDGLGLGAVQQNSLPSAVAALVRRTSIASGPRYQGRIYIPGIPITAETNSRTTDTFHANLELAAVNLVSTLNPQNGTDLWIPVISAVPPVTTLDQVTDSWCDRVLRYQRRREVGVGE